jgi:putative phosphoesterase
VRESNLAYVGRRATEIRLQFDDKRLLMTHGSPWSPQFQYLTETSRELERCVELDVDFLVLGHSHLPYVCRVGRTLVINPGSVGRADQPEGGDTLSYAILDTNSDEVRHESFVVPNCSVRA